MLPKKKKKKKKKRKRKNKTQNKFQNYSALVAQYHVIQYVKYSSNVLPSK